MSLRILVIFALLGVSITAADSAAAVVWPPANLGPFTEACRTHPGLQSMTADQGGPQMEQLCTCFAGKVSGVSQADADMLTRDLLDTATADERERYAGYETLSVLASTSLEQCMTGKDGPVTAAVAAPAPQPAVQSNEVVEAPAAEPAPQIVPPPPPVAPIPEPAPPAAQSASIAPTPAGQPHRLSTEATGFLNACVSSKPFGGYLTQMRSGDESLQGTLCSCMTGALVEKVAATDFPLLALDFAEERRTPDAPPATYEASARAAKESLRSCMQGAGLKPAF